MLSRFLIVSGLVLIVAGLAVHYLPSVSMLGRLPGDIRIERPGVRFYFPVTTSILVSVVLSLILWLVSRRS